MLYYAKLISALEVVTTPAFHASSRIIWTYPRSPAIPAYSNKKSVWSLQTAVQRAVEKPTAKEIQRPLFFVLRSLHGLKKKKRIGVSHHRRPDVDHITAAITVPLFRRKIMLSSETLGGGALSGGRRAGARTPLRSQMEIRRRLCRGRV